MVSDVKKPSLNSRMQQRRLLIRPFSSASTLLLFGVSDDESRDIALQHEVLLVSEALAVGIKSLSSQHVHDNSTSHLKGTFIPGTDY